MRTSSKDLLIGLAGIGGLAGFATLLLLYGELTGVVTSRYTVEVAFDSGGGLRKGSPVTLNGVPVGEVQDVRLDPSVERPEHPVIVIARVDRTVAIPTNVSADVEAGLLGGSARLTLVIPLPIPEKPEVLPQESPPLIFGKARGLGGAIAEAIDERLAAPLEDLRTSARAFTRLADNLNSLVEEVDPDSADPAAVEGSLRTTVVRMNSTLAEARTAIGLASDWLGDAQLKQDVRNAVWRAGVLLEQTVEAVDDFSSLAKTLGDEAGRAVDSFDARAGELVAAVLPVADRASDLLERLGALSRLAAEGDGTVGRLLRNPDLHESLVDSARRLQATLGQLELLLQKIREEGLGVSFE